MARFDLLIKNGTIIDGSGSERFKGDVGVSEGKIVETGNLVGEDGARVEELSLLSLLFVSQRDESAFFPVAVLWRFI